MIRAAVLALLFVGCTLTSAPPPTPTTELASLISVATPEPLTRTAIIATAAPTLTASALAKQQVCHYVNGADADPSCTPGVWNPAVTQATIGQTICSTGWTATIRPPVTYTNPLKLRQLVEYGQPSVPVNYEEDHWFPLEGGGHPTDPHNLFPMPIDVARQKDVKENLLRSNICNGRQSLDEAHRLWEASWETYR